MNKRYKFCLTSLLLIGTIACTGALLHAQTSLFTYQGRLTDNTFVANGTYEMLFTLFDSGSGGTQIGAPLARTVVVTNGIFTVRDLSFGSPLAFSGASRYLEIAVRPDGSPNPFTTLNPRQSITSAPYSIRSLNSSTADTATNSTQLGGVAASQFVQTDDTRLTDERNPLAGSNNYVQNQNAAPQTSANFNIGGTGSANVINSATQYNLGGNRLLSVSNGTNFFAGINVGTSSTTGNFNAFFGTNAGASNTTANANSFFGYNAGQANTTGFINSFFGNAAGVSNTTGSSNAFLGDRAGASNTTAHANSFVGSQSGEKNTTGAFNSFFGQVSGFNNTTGTRNSFFGTGSGFMNTTASDNTFFGFESGKANTIGEGNVFVGKSAGGSNTEGGSNSFFGKGSGANNTTGSLNSFVGVEAGGSNTDGGQNTFVGSSAGYGNTVGSYNSFFGSQGVGFSNTSGNSNAFFGGGSGYNNTGGSNNSFFGSEAGNNNTTGNNNAALGSGANVGAVNLTFATAIGAGAVVSTSNTIALGRSNGMDKVRVYGLGAAGATALCRNANNEISTCSSSLRYKTNIASFNSGLNVVNRLRPITFDWKEGGMADLGLGAEDVEKIEPLLLTYNQAGEVEGIKYDRIGVVLLNAVKEQQTQIQIQQENARKQQAQIEQQQIIIEGLRKLVCQNNPQAGVCKEGENK